MQLRKNSRNDCSTALGRNLRIWAAPVVSVFVLMGAPPSLGNGGKSKAIHYEARIRLGEAGGRECTFSTDIDPVLFYMTSVQNKYQVIKIRVKNDTPTPLVLSSSKDSMELHFGSRVVSSLLNIPAADPQLWSSLSLDLRQAIAYPSHVEAGEEEGVYVFVAKTALSTFAARRSAPNSIRYSVESQASKTIDLSPPIATAAKQ